MSAQHTPGPVHVGGDGTIVYDKDGWGVCNAQVFHGRHGGPEVAKANARRLVACWNACEGISTEHLEACLSLGERIVEFRRTGIDEAHGLLAAAREVAAALDALLQQKPMLAATVCGSTTMGNHRVQLNAAIAKVTGSAA